MKIIQDKPSEHGNFSIEATIDREIISIFTDYETGLLIIQETLVEDAARNSKPIYINTIDKTTGELVPLEQRAAYINYASGEEIEEELQVKRVFSRVVNAETGNEFIEEELFALSDGKTLQSSGGVAFRPKKRDTIFDSYRETLAMRQQIIDFWAVEYPRKSQEEKIQYWARSLHQQMRWQGESGLDEYIIYSKEWLAECKKKDSDFENILEAVFQQYFTPYQWDVEEIRKRIQA